MLRIHSYDSQNIIKQEHRQPMQNPHLKTTEEEVKVHKIIQISINRNYILYICMYITGIDTFS